MKPKQTHLQSGWLAGRIANGHWICWRVLHVCQPDTLPVIVSVPTRGRTWECNCGATLDFSPTADVLPEHMTEMPSTETYMLYRHIRQIWQLLSDLDIAKS
jgi:hypothetical protein